MKLEIYGNSKTGFSAQGEHDASDPRLLPCPFCGSGDLTCSNTHTPYYSVTCHVCSAEGPTGSPPESTQLKRNTPKYLVKLAHTFAFNAAIRKWNGARR